MSRRRRSRRKPIQAVINVTSLTDVALVLLIIFLITATFLGVEQGVDIALPGAASATPREDVGAITVVVSSDGQIHIDDHLIAVPQLVPAFEERLETGATQVVIRDDRGASYEAVFLALDAAKVAGVTDIALATVPIDSTTPAGQS